jgi:hypothetical protein
MGAEAHAMSSNKASAGRVRLGSRWLHTCRGPVSWPKRGPDTGLLKVGTKPLLLPCVGPSLLTKFRVCHDSAQPLTLTPTGARRLSHPRVSACTLQGKS